MRISDWSSDVCSSDLADKITVDGTSLRFSDATYSGLMTGGGASFASLGASAGALVAVTGYANAAVIAGTAYGSEASGIRPATLSEFANPDAFVLSDGSGANRFPIRAGDRKSTRLNSSH